MKPRDHDSDSLARWADRALGQLPARPAPASLAPRVLAEIRRRANPPWYRRPWLRWPAPQRGLSALLLATGLYGFFGRLVPSLNDAAAGTEIYRRLHRLPGFLDSFSDAVAEVAHAIALTASTVPPWAGVAVVGIAAFSWISTVGLGTACWRIARPCR